MDVKRLPNVDALRARLRYVPDTGELFWKHDPSMHKRWNSRNAGKAAFTVTSPNGYRYGYFNDDPFLAHRIIWKICHGHDPIGQIDHINGNRADNRLVNLRDVSCSANQRNSKLRVDNSSGICGVRWNVKRAKWCAKITNGGKHKHLGYFADFDAAVSARKEAEQQFGYHANHGRAA